jgi:hypothetical protein
LFFPKHEIGPMEAVVPPCFQTGIKKAANPRGCRLINTKYLCIPVFRRHLPDQTYCYVSDHSFSGKMKNCRAITSSSY